MTGKIKLFNKKMKNILLCGLILVGIISVSALSVRYGTFQKKIVLRNANEVLSENANICIGIFSGIPENCADLSLAQTKQLIEKIKTLPDAGEGAFQKDLGLEYRGIVGSLSSGSELSTDNSPTSFRVFEGLVSYNPDIKASISSMGYFDEPNPNLIYKIDEGRKLEKWLVGLFDLDNELKKVVVDSIELSGPFSKFFSFNTESIIINRIGSGDIENTFWGTAVQDASVQDGLIDPIGISNYLVETLGIQNNAIFYPKEVDTYYVLEPSGFKILHIIDQSLLDKAIIFSENTYDKASNTTVEKKCQQGNLSWNADWRIAVECKTTVFIDEKLVDESTTINCYLPITGSDKYLAVEQVQKPISTNVDVCEELSKMGILKVSTPDEVYGEYHLNLN